MPDDTPTAPYEREPSYAPAGMPRWDPQEILRRRVEAAQTQLEKSVAALRSAMDDDQIRDEFGINLDAINPTGNSTGDIQGRVDDRSEWTVDREVDP